MHSTFFIIIETSICHKNTRSLVLDFQQFKRLTFNEYDIIMVSETWLSADFDEKLVYKMCIVSRQTRGGCVAIDAIVI